MKLIRIIAILLLLLSGSNNCYAFPTGIDQFSLDNKNTAQLTEDLQELSYSNLATTFHLFTKRTLPCTATLPNFGNLRERSRVKGYFSMSYLIRPGLGLADIIFPFHSFL